MSGSHVRTVLTRVARIANRHGVAIPERVFRHLHFEGPFDLPLPGGKHLKLYSRGNRVENELAWHGWNGHEPLERERWVQMVSRPGDVLDIGANTGTFAFTAKAIQPEARVVAFEAIPRIAEFIKRNIEVSVLQVQIVAAAVADEPGELPIHDPGGANAYGASLEADFLPGEKEVYTVPVTSIDQFCADNDMTPVSIKIDVEGSEAKVLFGAKNTLAKKQSLVLCEW